MSGREVAAVIEQDRNGVITGWDSNAHLLFGWSRAEAVGMRSHLLIPPRNRARHDQNMADFVASVPRRVLGREITSLHRDGHEFPVEFTIAVEDRSDGLRVVTQARQVTSDARAATAFRQIGERYRAILDQIEDGCSVVDLRGNYLFVNHAFCRMFNVSKEELIGANFKQSAGADLSETLTAIYASVYRTGQPVKAFEYQFARHDQTIVVEQSVSLDRDAEGRPVGFLTILRDSTERARVRQELARAKEAAENANRAKSEFLANMSHEIRTPMNGIIGMTMLALDTDLTPYQADCLDTVRGSAESLMTILNDILDFSKIESRKLEMEAVAFSLGDTIADALKPLGVRAHQKGLELLSDIAPDVPADIVGDPIRLKQIVNNLVGNAIKFTDRGHVVVSVRQEKRGEGCIMLHFVVSDTGVGVPADQQAAIFEAFRQVDGSTTRKFGGTGLGLAISTSLVTMMGGRLWVESEPDAGSAFHFTAAFDVTDSPCTACDKASLAGLRVLIVDDNPANRGILDTQIRTWAMVPTAVDGGQAAFDALTAAARDGRPFDVVLLDANMPGLDGFAVAEQASLRPDLAGSIIMMLSSSGLEGDVARCRALGVAAYLTKPIKASDLLEAMTRAVGGAATARTPAKPGPKVTAPARLISVLVAEDNVVNQRVAVGLLTSRGHTVTVVGNGRETLAALERDAYDLVLMDVQMPVMGGFEATVAIRARERQTGGHVRIVAMTAHAMNGDRERCVAAGMDGYLSKPIDPRMLFAIVEGDAPAGPAPASAFDRSATLERLNGDEALLADVIGLFLDDCPARLRAIKTAVDARDSESIRIEAHGLKGAAGNLSALGLFNAAQILERIGAEARLDAADAAWRLLSMEASQALDALRHFETRETSARI